MDFLTGNKVSKAILYWRDKTVLDRAVEAQIKVTQGKIRGFLNDIRGLVGPGAAIEGVSMFAKESAKEAFAVWEKR